MVKKKTKLVCTVRQDYSRCSKTNGRFYFEMLQESRQLVEPTFLTSLPLCCSNNHETLSLFSTDLSQLNLFLVA